MWKSFLIGLGLGLSFIIVAFVTDHSLIFSYVTGGIGLIALLISGIASNNWSKDKNDADTKNYALKDADRFKSRRNMYRLALFSTPLLITTLFLYFT
ncbi:hypothetical protein [Cytobacillus gottheilii]|uniref:hypothetical protein n=1 Tax=Cytobacillus gottheilii TaxID=859144 RepID=UPI0009B9788C|nr:hypothetical protein [Cytobacillus gottheilii]